MENGSGTKCRVWSCDSGAGHILAARFTTVCLRRPDAPRRPLPPPTPLITAGRRGMREHGAEKQKPAAARCSGDADLNAATDHLLSPSRAVYAIAYIPVTTPLLRRPVLTVHVLATSPCIFGIIQFNKNYGCVWFVAELNGPGNVDKNGYLSSNATVHTVPVLVDSRVAQLRCKRGPVVEGKESISATANGRTVTVLCLEHVVRVLCRIKITLPRRRPPLHGCVTSRQHVPATRNGIGP
ncbi:hypothetical protein GWI33_010411 [Rhynchophorus ferrugineus]|uniref:Uncharacterized protein n=1 Tax=Rhynchophorus ferrugineus TaxID=354439 RepID=A0A834IT51_RHYFE|nr:hypothetical protein GWI33_010411 [Rhynchophorus ferrugineus]